MTIAAGFRFNGGVILCADTQETIDEYSKTWTPKLIVKPQPWYANDSPDDLMVAFAGAGDGPFIDKIVERAWKDMESSQNFDDACQKIEESIEETHRKYRDIFQVGYLPNCELLCGIKMQGKSTLYHVVGSVVNEKKYAAIGVGKHLSNFLTAHLHDEYLPGPQAVILAAYVLFQCIEHVDGCGGDLHIAGLNETGNSRMINPIRISFVVEQLKGVQNAVSMLLLSAPDFSIRPDIFENQLQSVVRNIKELRGTGQRMKQVLEEIEARRSTSQTSELEQ